jgi:hypothetical protein
MGAQRCEACQAAVCKLGVQMPECLAFNRCSARLASLHMVQPRPYRIRIALSLPRLGRVSREAEKGHAAPFSTGDLADPVHMHRQRCLTVRLELSQCLRWT